MSRRLRCAGRRRGPEGPRGVAAVGSWAPHTGQRQGGVGIFFTNIEHLPCAWPCIEL